MNMTIDRLDYPKYPINLHVTSRVEADLRLKSCAKEPETVSWLEGLPRGVLFDIGANVGAYSLVAAAVGHKVFSFEPPGPTYDRLEQNLDLNPDLRVWAYPVLLGDENETVPFSFSSMEPGAACHSLGASGENVLNLPMQTLDSVCSDKNLPWPEYLKIDTDGSELRILVGAEEALEHVSALQVEVDDSIPSSTHVPSFLQKKGFTVREWHRHRNGHISNVQFSRS